ncbi:MAG: hypothetical protein J3K34DRAFT_422668 [Monoraphidium minutum]|nr:MAG: hypothetical protein J3K34DRAFT_422668 [Monoraphidium minutum]
MRPNACWAPLVVSLIPTPHGPGLAAKQRAHCAPAPARGLAPGAPKRNLRLGSSQQTALHRRRAVPWRTARAAQRPAGARLGRRALAAPKCLGTLYVYGCVCASSWPSSLSLSFCEPGLSIPRRARRLDGPQPPPGAPPPHPAYSTAQMPLPPPPCAAAHGWGAHLPPRIWRSPGRARRGAPPRRPSPGARLRTRRWQGWGGRGSFRTLGAAERVSAPARPRRAPTPLPADQRSDSSAGAGRRPACRA